MICEIRSVVHSVAHIITYFNEGLHIGIAIDENAISKSSKLLKSRTMKEHAKCLLETE